MNVVSMLQLMEFTYKKLTFANTVQISASQAFVSSTCEAKYPAKPCGDGWYRINSGRCAKYFMDKRTFDDAENHCVSLGGHLVSIHSVGDYSNVLCLALRTTNNGNLFWIGGRGMKSDFWNLKWTDGSSFNFYRRNLQQPDNKHESCIQLNYGDWWRWTNDVCSSKRYFVCAKSQ
uniref:C-type lectin domain-containing protein n=1 Tax=Mola mola TaxID=94237 RepID=A0A3Q3WUP9_MOLML